MRTRLFLLVLLVCGVASAQQTMRIHYHDGSTQDVPMAAVDSISFPTQGAVPQETTLLGSWLWGSVEAGYYELLTFNDDHTYLGYDNYFTYGFDTQTYGQYVQVGNMLTLRSYGYGYNRTYRWFVTALTANALEVMTPMGRFAYYRLQPDVLHLAVGGTLAAGDDGSRFVFADGVVARADEAGRLQGLARGTTYVLKQQGQEGPVVAHQLIVE